MHNIFITEFFDWNLPPTPSRKVQWINKVLSKLGFWSQILPPRFSGWMTNVEQRMNMFHLASQVLVYEVPGDFVELGCHTGKSAVVFQQIINHYDPTRRLHVYDSFQGLAEIKIEDGDTNFYEGQMAVEQDQVVRNFAEADLAPPIIHPGWFADTLPNELPERIAFAHLDGDLYDSMLVSLENVYPRLTKGAVCLIDDYADPEVYDGWNELPGVKRASDEYLRDKPEMVSVLYAGDYAHGYFHKLS